MARDRRTRMVDAEEEQFQQMDNLVAMLNDAILVCEDINGKPDTRQVAEYLIERGVVIKGKTRGSTTRKRRSGWRLTGR